MSKVHSIIVALLIASVLNCVWAQSPPQLNAKIDNNEHIVRVGESITLECPVTKSKGLIFEWYKEKEYIMTFGGQKLRILGNGSLKVKETIFDDTGIYRCADNGFGSEEFNETHLLVEKESIMRFGGSRLRILSNGSLRIREAVFGDTGVYRCRAINGFGNVELNTTLLVIGEDESYDEYPDMYENEDMDFDSSKITKPCLLYVTKDESPIHRKPGSSFRLQCVASGYPKPKIIWLKDGLRIPKAFRAGHWGLQFTNALPTDSGNYTCIASNGLGTTSHSFYVFIDENKNAIRGKPSLNGKNTTVEEGEKAVLECGIKSTQFPHMEWLKQVEPGHTNVKGSKGTPIPMEGEYFSVLTSPYGLGHVNKDGIYYHRLIIDNVQREDAGKYVCLGANSYGYKYHFVFLEVIPKERTFYSTVPFPIVVTATVVAVAVLGCIFALLVYCRPRSRTGSQGSTAGVPMVTKEDFIPMQVGPSMNGRGSAKSKRSRSKQQVTYVAQVTSDMV